MARYGLLIIGALLLAGIAGSLLFLEGESLEKKGFIIGVINPNPGAERINELFVAELQEHAQQEGWELIFHHCIDKATFDDDLEKLVALHPDLVFTVTTPGTQKAFQAFQGSGTAGIFVLFDPVKAEVINSLSRPGGNFTGVQLRGSVPKALEWLLAVVPATKNVFVPVKFDTGAAKMSLADLKKAAKILGVRLTVAEVNTREELVASLAAIPEETDAVFLLNSILISTHAGIIAEEAIKKKLPTAASIGKDQEGVLITYSTQHRRAAEQAARLARQVLHGENPRDIPSEIANFYLHVNLKTAEKIGLTIPETILAQADELIR